MYLRYFPRNCDLLARVRAGESLPQSLLRAALQGVPAQAGSKPYGVVAVLPVEEPLGVLALVSVVTALVVVVSAGAEVGAGAVVVSVELVGAGAVVVSAGVVLEEATDPLVLDEGVEEAVVSETGVVEAALALLEAGVVEASVGADALPAPEVLVVASDVVALVVATVVVMAVVVVIVVEAVGVSPAEWSAASSSARV